jgi:hypothetical protein
MQFKSRDNLAAFPTAKGLKDVEAAIYTQTYKIMIWEYKVIYGNIWEYMGIYKYNISCMYVCNVM